MRKVLQPETGSLSGGNHRWFRRHTREKRLVSRDMMMMMMMMMMTTVI